jgi:hypothetical protein
VAVSIRQRLNRTWIGVAGLAIGALAFASDMNGNGSLFRAVYSVLTGWAFIGVAYLLWDRLPDSSLPLLIALVGFTFFIGDFFNTHVPIIVGLSVWFGDLFRVLLAHAGLSHPTGRLRSRVALIAVGVGYAFIFVVGLIRAMADNPYLYETCECPRNAIGFIHSESFFDAVDAIYGIIGAILAVVVIVLLLRMYATSGRGGGVMGLPWLAVTGAFVMMMAMDILTDVIDFSPSTQDWLYLPVHIALAGAALSFLLAFRGERLPVTRAASEAA